MITRTSFVIIVTLVSFIYSYALQLKYARVHEAITQEAAKKAGIGYSEELEKGIRWNDLPCETNVNSTTVEICSFAFVSDIETPGTITYESHNGKYSYWHSMAVPGRYTNYQLVAKIMKQMSIWYQIAVTHHSDFSIGKCLHMVQDACSRAHVSRDSHFQILFFQDYTLQDAEKHSNLEGGHICGRKPYDTLYGYHHAVQASTKLLSFYKQRAPWAKVKAYLKSTIYKLAPGVRFNIAGGTIKEAAVEHGKSNGHFLFHLATKAGIPQAMKQLKEYRNQIKSKLQTIQSRNSYITVLNNEYGHHHYHYEMVRVQHKDHYHIHHYHHHDHFHDHHHTLGLRDSYNRLRQKASKAWEKTKSVASSVKHNVKRRAQGTINTMKNKWKELTNKLVQALKKNFGTAKRLSNTVFSNLGKMACRSKAEAKEGIQKFGSSLRAQVTALKNDSYLSSLWNKWKQWRSK